MSNLYTNQFGQSVVIGDCDLEIMRSGSISGILSPSQATPDVVALAGQPAKIDTTITSGSVVNFLVATKNDLAVGFFKRLMKKTTFAINEVVEVVGSFGPVIWLLADGTITPGATVYNQTDVNHVDTTSTGAKARGIALDYAITGQVLRVLVTNPLTINS